MTEKAILVLEDGSVYQGYAFGAAVSTYGEVVFNTSMTGYQEMLTDPSYAGQIVVPTYPLIGNYGINKEDFESKKIQVRGFVVREECLEPNHYLGEKTIDEFLKEYRTPGICGVGDDLRANFLILFICKAATLACSRLDKDLVAVFDNLLYACRRHGHTIFVIFDLLGYTDYHEGFSFFMR